MESENAMTFAEAMSGDPSRLVVQFQRGSDGSEQYQWGAVGVIPVLSLIGQVARVQAELPLLEPGDERHTCPQPALVILSGVNGFEWFVHPEIPVDSLCGMLEMIKAMLVNSRLAQQTQQRVDKPAILGVDGKPMRF